jgi:hypothetical protein
MSKKYTNIPDTITLNHMGYNVTGTVAINLWGGETAYIDMKPIYIEQAVKDAEALYDLIREGLNDNGFGCERILGAHVDIYAVYSNQDVYTSTKVYIGHLWLDKDKDIPTPESIKCNTEIYYYNK